MSVASDSTQILAGGKIQFNPNIVIPVAQLLSGQEFMVELPAASGTVWMPPSYILNGQVMLNPLTAMLAVRFNLPSSPQFPFGLMANAIASFSGPVKRIYVTYLGGPTPALPILLHSGTGIGVAYSGGANAAGTATTAPAVSGSAPQS